MTSPTAINDIGDLLRILEERPEWAERLRAILLTREILELPERITQLTARVDHFIQAQEEFNRAQQETNARLDQRLDRLAAAQEATNARLDHFIQAQEAANARIDRRLENLEEFTRAQQEINARMDQRLANLEEFNRTQEEFNRTQEEFNRTQEEFNRAQQETNARMEQRLENLEVFNRKQEEFNRAQDEFNRSQRETNAGVDRRLNNLENQVGSLLGSDLENRLHGNITSIAARNFNLRRVRILKSRFFPPDQNFYDRLYAAEDAGNITNEQSIQLQEADFILSAQEREARGQIYLAVEVSRTVVARDITRARERADALRDATGVSSMALVIGNFIPEPEQARAREHSVTLIQQPPD